MPELPEVETTLRGIAPYLLNHSIKRIIIRDHRLRWPIDPAISQFEGEKIIDIQRRGKYILLTTPSGAIIIHLGMSGRVRILSANEAPKKHDHYDIVISKQVIMRYTDPRRFGALLWSTNPYSHPLLKTLGVEPLEKDFTSKYLHQACKNKSAAIKSVIMNGKIVVGVGNIYATEALFTAKIHPATPAKLVSLIQIQSLVKAIKSILRRAIEQGGTTLRDFTDSAGKPGYFVQKLNVYGRDDLPCVTCATKLKTLRIAQRSTVYCPKCQKTA